MTTFRRSVLSLLSLAALSAAAVSHPALAKEDQAAIRKLQETGKILSLAQIAAAARAIKPGDILETELEQKKSGYVYEVEILDSAGQVWELKMDAQSGKLIKLEVED